MDKMRYLSRALFLLGLLIILVTFGYITLDIHWVYFAMYIGVLLLLIGSLIYKVPEKDNNQQED